jgi:RimJ/RimL family protein N-acetyltransferase
MTLSLDTPTFADLTAVLAWRKTCPETLRTPRDLTNLEQEAFYRDCICNGASKSRYYAVREDGSPDSFVALVSLENISWENGSAEIGLIVDPAHHNRGIGRQAVALVLDVAFNRLRLLTVWGETYEIGHPAFWQHVTTANGGTWTVWPRRKFWNGALHDATLFTITEEGWRASLECVA